MREKGHLSNDYKYCLQTAKLSHGQQVVNFHLSGVKSGLHVLADKRNFEPWKDINRFVVPTSPAFRLSLSGLFVLRKERRKRFRQLVISNTTQPHQLGDASCNATSKRSTYDAIELYVYTYGYDPFSTKRWLYVISRHTSPETRHQKRRATAPSRNVPSITCSWRVVVNQKFG